MYKKIAVFGTSGASLRMKPCDIFGKYMKWKAVEDGARMSKWNPVEYGCKFTKMKPCGLL